MALTTYKSVCAQPAEFVHFWSAQYDYTLDRLYEENIGRPMTSDKVFALFEWKNGSRLSDKKRMSVQRNYVDRLGELQDLPANVGAEEFLGVFSRGGAIWRIFWLHCNYPDRFPIYDQHVHRAMTCILDQRVVEIPRTDNAKIVQYTTRYISFYNEFGGIGDRRAIDRALWAYGKFLKGYNFPQCQPHP